MNNKRSAEDEVERLRKQNRSLKQRVKRMKMQKQQPSNVERVIEKRDPIMFPPKRSAASETSPAMLLLRVLDKIAA